MAAAERSGPRAGSVAHRALLSLHSIGKMAIPTWMGQVEYGKSTKIFQREVVERLLGWGLIEASGLLYCVTPAGREHLGCGDVPVVIGVITPGAYVPPRRDLSPHNRPALRVMRPGAFDYRDIPSLYAGKPVEYRSSITVQHKDVPD